jgi:glycogen operon protein
MPTEAAAGFLESASFAAPRTYSTRPGTHYPPGAAADAEGVNFSIVSRDAVAAELRLYEGARSGEPFQIIRLASAEYRTFLFWHVYVEGLPPGIYYTWRVAGPGQNLDTATELLDPWARAVSDSCWDRRATQAGAATGKSLRGIVTPCAERPLDASPASRNQTDLVIYEMHVGGFTRHPSSGVSRPGSFAGLIEKIPYLKELGVTHVELLPVMAFDEQDVPPGAMVRGLRNYWGYSCYGFFAPHPRFCADPRNAPREFAACVRALHGAGIGVLLDVVFNHTAEGGTTGPTINFKALANEAFYHHEANDISRYRDYTGCGNTINCNHPLVTNFILHCLEYWVKELGVDGFRFDLASVFTRGEDGVALANPPLTWGIELSHALVHRPVIAEAWDAAGLYHVGAFPGMRWAEWNGRYRDTMRRFVRGDPGMIGEVAARLAGSQDMYGNRTPLHSVNFVTCHDGFTLSDLVSHGHKHNEANGEDNRDGNNDNLTWNCGAEGETGDGAVLALRRRQAKNFMAILLLSQGTPMILAGDEVLRTQGGNNNAYCQDNEISWFDWRLIDANRDMLRFTREMIALRRRHPNLRRRYFLTGRPAAGAEMPDITWHGEQLGAPPWFDSNARLLAYTLAGTSTEEMPLHVILNMSDEPRAVDLPSLSGYRWRRAADTALDSPDDITPPDRMTATVGDQYTATPRSVVVLEARSI